MASLFSKIHSQAETSGIVPRSKQSAKWFLTKIREMTSISSTRILNDSLLEARKKPLVGRMFMFLYDPKGKDTLPYYDRFPLILMVGPAEKGFYGLNLHYLPPRERAIFFDRLMEFTNNKKYDETTRFRITYNLLSSVGKLRAFQACFKHYLFDHID